MANPLDMDDRVIVDVYRPKSIPCGIFIVCDGFPHANQFSLVFFWTRRKPHDKKKHIDLYEEEVPLQWDVQHVSAFSCCCDNQSTTFKGSFHQAASADVIDKVNFAQNCSIIFIYPPANIAMENGWT